MTATQIPWLVVTREVTAKVIIGLHTRLVVGDGDAPPYFHTPAVTEFVALVPNLHGTLIGRDIGHGVITRTEETARDENGVRTVVALAGGVEVTYQLRPWFEAHE